MRGRRWWVPVLLVLIAVGILSVVGDDGGIPTGDALENENSTGASGPVDPGDPLTFGLVHTHNQSDEPVELVSARMLRLDPDLRLLGFSAAPSRSAPVTLREARYDKAVPLPDFPAQPPADDTQFVVLFGLEVRPGGSGGYALGVELTYLQGDKLRKQEFETSAYICTGPAFESDCADDALESLGDYDDEVKKGEPAE